MYPEIPKELILLISARPQVDKTWLHCTDSFSWDLYRGDNQASVYVIPEAQKGSHIVIHSIV